MTIFRRLPGSCGTLGRGVAMAKRYNLHYAAGWEELFKNTAAMFSVMEGPPGVDISAYNGIREAWHGIDRDKVPKGLKEAAEFYRRVANETPSDSHIRVLMQAAALLAEKVEGCE